VPPPPKPPVNKHTTPPTTAGKNGKLGKQDQPANDLLSSAPGKPSQTSESPHHGNPTPATLPTAENSNLAGSSTTSQQGPLLHIASLDPTSVSLTSNSDPSVAGQPVTFTAQVSSSWPGTETGNVLFYDGATELGSVALSADSGGAVATFTTSSLNAGSHSITASYSGDSTFAGSTSSTLTQVVRNTSSVSVSANINPGTLSQAVTFTATVSAPAGGAPTGSVQFQDGGQNLGNSVNLSNGVATLSVATLTAGVHAITAVYQGSPFYAGSTSSSYSETINPIGTTTTMTATPRPSVFGQAVTLTATVSSSGAGTPNGTVQFFDGGTAIGSPATLNGSGVATLQYSGLPAGGHSLTAVYGGSSSYASSNSSAISQTVNQASTSTTLRASPSSGVFGQSITFTATVAPVSPGGGVPSGTVQFKQGATVLGSATLDGSGVASFTTSALGTGSDTITTVYNGDGNFQGGSPATGVTEAIDKDNSSVIVTSSDNAPVAGETIQLTVTVSAAAPGSGTPTGTVTLQQGANTPQTATLSNGQAVFTVSSLSLGQQNFMASYAGDDNFNGGSGGLTLIVGQAATTTALAIQPAPSVYGQMLTLTATVSVNQPGAGTPAGTVTFKDGNQVLGAPGLAVVNGVVQARFQIATLAAGAHNIQALYSGDNNFTASNSAVTVQTVNKSNTTTTLAAAPAPSSYGQGVTLTATVSANAPGAGTPSGEVFFYDGAVVAGSGTLNGVAGADQASVTIFSLAAGAHNLVAVYQGDSNFNSSQSSNLGQNVSPSATTTSVQSSTATPVHGQSVTFTATVSAVSPGIAKGQLEILKIRFFVLHVRLGKVFGKKGGPARKQARSGADGCPRSLLGGQLDAGGDFIPAGRLARLVELLTDRDEVGQTDTGGEVERLIRGQGLAEQPAHRLDEPALQPLVGRGFTGQGSPVLQPPGELDRRPLATALARHGIGVGGRDEIRSDELGGVVPRLDPAAGGRGDRPLHRVEGLGWCGRGGRWGRSPVGGGHLVTPFARK
jgi:hypothetical protein